MLIYVNAYVYRYVYIRKQQSCHQCLHSCLLSIAAAGAGDPKEVAIVSRHVAHAITNADVREELIFPLRMDRFKEVRIYNIY